MNYFYQFVSALRRGSRNFWWGEMILEAQPGQHFGRRKNAALQKTWRPFLASHWPVALRDNIKFCHTLYSVCSYLLLLYLCKLIGHNNNKISTEISGKANAPNALPWLRHWMLYPSMPLSIAYIPVHQSNFYSLF